MVAFACVTLIRTKARIKERLMNSLYCILGEAAEMLVIAIPIITQAGISTLIDGIHDKLNPYPQGSMYSGTSADKLKVLKGTYMQWLPYLLIIFAFVFVFSLRYIRENEKNFRLRGRHCYLWLPECFSYDVLLLPPSGPLKCQG